MATKLGGKIENTFEALLWRGRLITLLAVIFSSVSSFALFLAGSNKIFQAIVRTIQNPSADVDYNYLLIDIIGAVDLYLIAVVLLIFSFGVYELFISKIDLARYEKDIDILEIKSLDDLKSRLFKVIIMALIVYFFKSILTIHFEKPTEILILAISILAVAGSSIFIRKMD